MKHPPALSATGSMRAGISSLIFSTTWLCFALRVPLVDHRSSYQLRSLAGARYNFSRTFDVCGMNRYGPFVSLDPSTDRVSNPSILHLKFFRAADLLGGQHNRPPLASLAIADMSLAPPPSLVSAKSLPAFASGRPRGRGDLVGDISVECADVGLAVRQGLARRP
jgi:hypothetical protein